MYIGNDFDHHTRRAKQNQCQFHLTGGICILIGKQVQRGDYFCRLANCALYKNQYCFIEANIGEKFKCNSAQNSAIIILYTKHLWRLINFSLANKNQSIFYIKIYYSNRTLYDQLYSLPEQKTHIVTILHVGINITRWYKSRSASILFKSLIEYVICGAIDVLRPLVTDGAHHLCVLWERGQFYCLYIMAIGYFFFLSLPNQSKSIPP